MPVEGSLNLPPLIAEVTNTVLSHATGDDQPRPFTSTLHATLSFADHARRQLAVGQDARARRAAKLRPGHRRLGDARATEGADEHRWENQGHSQSECESAHLKTLTQAGGVV